MESICKNSFHDIEVYVQVHKNILACMLHKVFLYGQVSIGYPVFTVSYTLLVILNLVWKY